jgi:hypothetical protein
MRKFALLVTVLALGLVVGCARATPSPTATPSPVPTIPPTAVSAATATASPPGTVACRAAPFGKVEGLPPVSDRDWVRGPADASITLIEYSDFQ